MIGSTQIRQQYRASRKRQESAVKAGDSAIRELIPLFGEPRHERTRHVSGTDGGARGIRRGRVTIRTDFDPAREAAWALGQAIRAARLKKGVTQEELGLRTGMARPNIARIESGRHCPSVETLARIAGALRVSVRTLMRKPAAPMRDADDQMTDVEGWASALEREDRA